VTPEERTRVVVWVGKLLQARELLYRSCLITTADVLVSTADVLVSTATFERLVAYLQELDPFRQHSLEEHVLSRGAMAGRPALFIHGMTLSPCYEVDADDFFIKMSLK